MRKSQPATSRLFSLVLLLVALPLGLAAYSHVRIVRLSLVEGEVYMERPGEAEWTRGAVNLPLMHNAVVETGNGVAEVEFESGAFARLATDARLHLAELGLLDSGGRVTQLSLERGTATFYAKLRGDDSFMVLTPYFQVNVAKRAKFRIDLTAAGGRVRIFTGQVNVDSPAGTLTVSKDRMYEWYAASGRYLLARNPDRDAWDEWNDDRDNVTYGLAYYGDWRYLPGFGQVWRPLVGAGWTPFLYGRWLWYGGLGWTWLSFEPWGWLPYHYGSWYYDPFWRWVWVPGFFDYWSPARCFWVRRPGWVGWGPVQPGGGVQGGGSTPAQPRKLPRGTVVVSEDGFSRGDLPKLAESLVEEGGQPWQLGVAPRRERLRSIPSTTDIRPSRQATSTIEFDPETGRYVNRTGATPQARFGTKGQQGAGEAAEEQQPARFPMRPAMPATSEGEEQGERPRGTITGRERPQRPSVPVVPERPRVDSSKRPRQETGPRPSAPSRPPVVRSRPETIPPSGRVVQPESPRSEHSARPAPPPAPRASQPRRPATAAPSRPMPRPQVRAPAARPSPRPAVRPRPARPRPAPARPRPQ